MFRIQFIFAICDIFLFLSLFCEKYINDAMEIALEIIPFEMLSFTWKFVTEIECVKQNSKTIHYNFGAFFILSGNRIYDVVLISRYLHLDDLHSVYFGSTINLI